MRIVISNDRELGAQWSQDVVVTVPGGNMVAEALVVDGASLSVSNEWMVGSNTSRDAYIGAPMRLRSDEDIALLADKENNVMVTGAGGVQVSTLGGTEILASRIAMATAWNEDARVTTAGGAVRTGHLEVSGDEGPFGGRSWAVRALV